VGWFEESLALFRELGESEGAIHALGALGCIALEQGDRDKAATLFEESLPLAEQLGSKFLRAGVLSRLGEVAWSRGDAERAAAFYQESLDLSREERATWMESVALVGLGGAARQQHHYEEAEACYRESLPLLAEVGERPGAGTCLEGLASVAVAHGAPERAARLLGAVQALRDAIGAPVPPEYRAAYERTAAAARTALGEEAFTAAWAEGRTMPWEQAVTYALGGDGTKARGGAAEIAVENRTEACAI
jgi:ATP/maltotriose-dependent transcriptional regulator MalT